MKGFKKRNEPLREHSIYLTSALFDFEGVKERFVQAMKSEKVKYDTMVGTGLSGALIVPQLARELDKHFMIVRKEAEDHHSSIVLEGKLGKRWLFVDDLISTGTTAQRVYDEIRNHARMRGFRTVCVGGWLYADHWFTDMERFRTK